MKKETNMSRRLTARKYLRLRRRLNRYAVSGAWAAHLPAFLDREPRYDLHRAYRAAFMRGFVREQNAMRVAV